ncbi:MAG: hypothetical protein ACJ741_05965 [Pyrinomonadaceae bacterium]
MKRQVTTVLTFLFFLTASPSMLGCVCEKTPSVAKAFKEADAVFSAKFVGAEYRKGIVDGLRRVMEGREVKKTDYEVLVLKFEVERWWKGNPVNEVILITGRTRDPDSKEIIPDCEYPFAEGELYLVYAYAGESGLETSNCTRTKRLKEAHQDLKVLRKSNKA